MPRSELQNVIFDALTDEPQTAAEIAEKIGHSTRSVASALMWMRDIADDGFGWRAFKGGEFVSEWPQEEWYDYRRPKWRKYPPEKIEAMELTRKTQVDGTAS